MVASTWIHIDVSPRIPQLKSVNKKPRSYGLLGKWRFPEIGLPPNHVNVHGIFHEINHLILEVPLGHRTPPWRLPLIPPDVVSGLPRIAKAMTRKTRAKAKSPSYAKTCPQTKTKAEILVLTMKNIAMAPFLDREHGTPIDDLLNYLWFTCLFSVAMWNCKRVFCGIPMIFPMQC